MVGNCFTIHIQFQCYRLSVPANHLIGSMKTSRATWSATVTVENITSSERTDHITSCVSFVQSCVSRVTAGDVW